MAQEESVIRLRSGVTDTSSAAVMRTIGLGDPVKIYEVTMRDLGELGVAIVAKIDGRIIGQRLCTAADIVSYLTAFACPSERG